MENNLKISLCTTCMNRLEYLKQTIDINIESIQKFNEKNKNKFELSLCNYDSKDGLHEFIINNYQEYIDSGLLIYTKVENKKYFSVCHAKNIAHKQSNGDILINLDSDNKINEKILIVFNDIFSKNIDDIFLTDKYNVGLIGISRYNFYKLGGYNEKMIGYGFEDFDLYERVEKYIGCKLVYLPYEFEYIKKHTIHQTVDIKYKNHKKTKPNGEILKSIYHMTYYNRDISDYYLERDIMNPNEFNKIEFGKI